VLVFLTFTIFYDIQEGRILGMLSVCLFYLQEITKFGTYVVRKFVEVAQTNKKVFIEMLFWKTWKEAMEVVDGYGSYERYKQQTYTHQYFALVLLWTSR